MGSWNYEWNECLIKQKEKEAKRWPKNGTDKNKEFIVRFLLFF